MGDRTLVIVPCGQRKVWDRSPESGAVAANQAYIGGPFRLNRAYAERVGDAWMILSAKYGLIPPDFIVPGSYDVTFNRRASQPVGTREIRQQLAEIRLETYARIVVLGGARYRGVIKSALTGRPELEAKLVFPTAGLGIGKAMQRLKQLMTPAAPYDGRSF
jgi:hypothetical protein